MVIRIYVFSPLSTAFSPLTVKFATDVWHRHRVDHLRLRQSVRIGRNRLELMIDRICINRERECSLRGCQRFACVESICEYCGAREWPQVGHGHHHKHNLRRDRLAENLKKFWLSVELQQTTCYTVTIECVRTGESNGYVVHRARSF